MIRTIESFEDLAGMREQWDELLQASQTRSIFLSHEWLCSWWKHLAGPRKLAAPAVYSDNRLIGVIPLALRPSEPWRMTPRVLEFVGSGIVGSDYLDAIVRRGFEEQVLAECEDHFTRAGHALQLSQLRRGSSLVERLAANLDRRWEPSSARINICPYIRLEGETWESYCAGLGSSQRYNFHRRLNNLKKSPGFRYECVTNPGEAVAALEILIELHRKRWNVRDGRSEAFQTAAVCNFHRDFVAAAAQRGWIRFYIVWIHTKPVAAIYGLRRWGTFAFYQSGFDPEFSKQSVGLVLTGLTIQAAIEEECTEYDFLHGAEAYKFHWTREFRELGRLELFPGVVRGRLLRRAVDFNRTVRRMARRMLHRAASVRPEQGDSA